MLFLIGLAFLAGIVTVLSPCVLPLLPVIFATAAQEGRSRPIGVMTGFVGSFTLATLALSFLVRTLGLPPDLNRILAATILILLGLVLVVPSLHRSFEEGASIFVGRLPGPRRSHDKGWLGGLAVGVGLGLAWSPCVGPIMASVVTLALNQQVNAGAVAVTLAFSIGTALPMAAIIAGGRNLINRMRWVQTHSEAIQRILGTTIVIVGVTIFVGWDRTLQAQLLTWFPNWEQALISWELRPNL